MGKKGLDAYSISWVVSAITTRFRTKREFGNVNTFYDFLCIALEADKYLVKVQVHNSEWYGKRWQGHKHYWR